MPVLVRVGSRAADGTPFLAEGELPISSAQNVAVYFRLNGNERQEGVGSLYVTTKNLVWLDSSNAEKGFSVEFRGIGLHAIARNGTTFPIPCIYTQLLIENARDLQTNNEDEVDEDAAVEMFLAPQDPVQLDAIFEAMNQAAALNPDSGSDGEGDLFFEEVAEGEFHFNNPGHNNGFDAMDEEEDDPDRYSDPEEDTGLDS